MFKTKFHAIGTTLVACSMAIGSLVSAQTAPAPKEAAQQKAGAATPATIAEMTRLSRELRVATLQKELREAKEEKKPAASGDMSAPGVPVVSARPARVIPQAPAVLAIYGTGGVLRARLASGQDVQIGSRAGLWRVASIEVAGVNFERCETSRKGAKKSECEIQFVAPANNG